MQKLILVFLLFIACNSNDFIAGSQQNEHGIAKRRNGVRYVDDVFTSVFTKSNVIYTNIVWNPYKNINETLKVDVYYPTGDTASGRWALLFIYGGGFWQGSKTIADNITFCNDMAKKGYVVFAIEYRKLPHKAQYANDSMRIVLGTPMAGSDARAAIRFIRSKAIQYRVNPNRIISYGTSSGGFTSMAAAYWEEVDTMLTANNANKGYTSTPNLAAESAGGLPMTAVENIEAGEAPIFNSHCDADSAVPFYYSLDCYNRAVAVGVSATNWWVNGACHGLISCCKADLLNNLTSWIYSKF